MKNINTSLNNNTAATNSLTTKLGVLEGDIAKIKDGLQIELFGSLQALHTVLKD